MSYALFLFYYVNMRLLCVLIEDQSVVNINDISDTKYNLSSRPL